MDNKQCKGEIMLVNWICKECGNINITTINGIITNLKDKESTADDETVTDYCNCGKEVEITVDLKVTITGVS